MRYLFVIIIFALLNYKGLAQTDTVNVKNQKGFLFLSSYHGQYDFKGGEVNPLGFHDFFFPVSNFDSTLFKEANVAIAVKNGLRVDYIPNRQPLKEAAHLYQGKDSSGCYYYDQFYIIPVTISYKQFKDNWPFVCRRNYFDIQVTGGASLHFEYQHTGIKPFNIKPLIGKKKTTVNLQKQKYIQKPKLHELKHIQKRK